MFTINGITFEQAALNPTLAKKHSFINAFVGIDEGAVEGDKVMFLFSKSGYNRVLYDGFGKGKYEQDYNGNYIEYIPF